MAHGFRKTTDLLSDPTGLDVRYYRQVINLILGANPNVPLIQPTTHKLAYNVPSAWATAFLERDRMISTLGMDPAQDEIDIEAIMDSNDDDLDFTKLGRIVYPPISSVNPQVGQPKGWIEEIYTSSDFNSAINSLFDVVFDSRTISAELLFTKYPDPDPSNDFATVTILSE